MVSFPPCKINLGLNVLSKRPDGYHDIETIFYPLPWTDILEIIPSDKLTFQTTGNAIPGKEADNLCLKAYHLLKRDFDLNPVQIHLHKIIPTGAGLGGGSADAAYTLRLLNEVFNLQLTAEKLALYASHLGSDCPFFVYDQPMLGTGRGEVLEKMELNLKGKFVVLVNPGVHIATATAYHGVTPGLPESSLKEVIQKPMKDWKHQLKNDFEKSIFKLEPGIKKLKEEMYEWRAIYSGMSGSGSSVFGIFENEIELPDFVTKTNYWSGML
jgi:4-diphosphocytidyl-2-C-methyl-D-erythritol kinase